MRNPTPPPITDDTRELIVRRRQAIATGDETSYAALNTEVRRAIRKVDGFLIRMARYADDTQLVISGPRRRLPDMQVALEKTLDTLATFFMQNGMKINAAKTELMIIGDRDALRTAATGAVPKCAPEQRPTSSRLLAPLSEALLSRSLPERTLQTPPGTMSSSEARSGRPLLLAVLAVTLLQPRATASALTTPSSPTPDGGDCMPAIAAKCFNEVARDLACQRGGVNCAGRDAVDMCYTLDDALNCTSDIIDGDCRAPDGRLTYDAWLRGLRSVQSHLCANDATNMQALIRPTPCWEPAQFLRCLESSATVHHPADLLRVQAGRRRVPTALSAFLLETPCRASCWEQPRPAGASGGGVAAIALLAVLAAALAAALAVVTYRTSCFRIPIARG
ncbi:hypothetical protein FJT64_023466 [Amphibalanus amphitrite]|uniref:Uncharacterized protein n=1 Tax=Amphibalanus amphitrite TaxID=1232801 RepID=A0A6A4WHS2_AMPAM|nr:hypothetical protein FJT64_023466 [Amphibalanus amphitrite]